MTIVDDSLSLPDPNDDNFPSTTVVFFHLQPDKLPKVQRAGDVIRLQRAGLQVRVFFLSYANLDHSVGRVHLCR